MAARTHSDQLLLPLSGVLPTSPSTVGIPRADRVFVNRNLKLSNVEWIGFDMDYTLAIYQQREMDGLSIEVTVDRLVRRGYPGYLRRLPYDATFPIRGLLIDKRHGHVLKLDRYKVVHKGYHGMQRLSDDDVDQLYHHKRIRPHTARYHWTDTLFGLSEVATYAAVIEAMEKRGERIDYARLFADVRESIDEAHADGTVYREVTNDLPRFIDRDPDLARTLHNFRSAGKRLFLLTNSPHHYTDTMMTYLLGAAMPEYPSWRHYFDVVMVAAQKPTWFQEGRDLKLRDGDVLRDVGQQLDRLEIYEGGSLRRFERIVGVRSNAILYVGDHIYGDILRTKKESSWHTAMIIQELDAEIAAHETCAEDLARIRHLEESRDHLEDELRYYQARYKTVAKQSSNGGDERVRIKRALERIRGELRDVDREAHAIEETVDRSFHRYWGSLLKERAEMSMFGVQVETYADIYTRRVSCLRRYSPQQFFRSPYDLMPHEL